MKTSGFILVCLILIQTSFYAEAAEMCSSIFGSAYTYRASQEVLDRFSYGYEVEFVPSQNPKILLYYKVAKYSDAIWLKMTLRQRLAAFNEYIGRYPKTVRTLMAGLGQIVMTRLENAPAFLPQKASVEAHGTIEISGEVFDKEVEMSARVRRTDETLGKGYWQAHVVFPKEYVNDISGFVSFSTDFAYLQSLSKSYERYLKNPQVIPGSVLVHYALGPISQKDFNSLINKNENALNGGRLGKGGQSRLIDGPALRDDVYPEGLAGIELRQFATRLEDMMDEVSFTTKLVSEGSMAKFNSFKKTQHLSDKIYEKITPEARVRWMKFMRMADQSAWAMSESIVVGGASYELRFLLPLLDWHNSPVVTESGMTAQEQALARNKVIRATSEYKSDIESLIASGIKGEKAVAALRIVISKWSYNSGLEFLFERYKERIE